MDICPRSNSPLDSRSWELRRDLVRMLRSARRGHVGSALSILEIVRVLYDSILRHDPAHPDWPDRDRFILSKGHGCLALYLLLAEKGYFPRTELARVGTLDGILGGHPEHGKVPGVEASTGSLGHGLSYGVGVALSGRMDGRGFRTFVLVGDGECGEGSIWEAALNAAKHRLNRLTVLVDCNRMQCYASTAEVSGIVNLPAMWSGFGFATREVDGHDVAGLEHALREVPFDAERPSSLICHTLKGRGIPFAEQNPEWHHKSSISTEQMEALGRAVGLDPA